MAANTSAMENPVEGVVGQQAGQVGHVLLKDVGHLVRLNAVAVPSGFSKLGNPLLYFPSDAENHFLNVAESDLHLLFKYYLAVVPRAEQAQGKDQDTF